MIIVIVVYGAQRLSASKITALSLALPTTIAATCAQRLSASKITALGGADCRGTPIPSCSTPFGIKDYCTNPRPFDRPTHLVLNAFRHQRLLHAHDYPRRFAIVGSAQRLSASKITARTSTSKRTAKLLGAQRLSASKITALPPPCRKPSSLLVLNAFRHQRLLHEATGQVAIVDRRCSTPFGIKDYCTPVIPCFPSGLCVCSTPFGIKDYCTRHWHTHPHNSATGAQRLSASKITAPCPKCLTLANG